jgi:hypothetical protein
VGRVTVTLLLTAATALPVGCAYDPYTGAVVPCCGYYGYPYSYRYPPPYPYGYPPGGQYAAPSATQPAPYQGQRQSYQGQGQSSTGEYQPPPDASYAPPGTASYPVQDTPLTRRFTAANVTNDGRLTRHQAEEGMPLVAQNFDAIDLNGKGYVTLPEVQAFMAQRRAAGDQTGQYDTN